VLNRILTPEYFLDLLNKVQERFKDQEQLSTQIKSTQVALAKVDRAINNLLDALETQGIGSASARLKEREAEKATLQAKLQELENKRTARQLKVSKEAIELVIAEWRGRLIQDLKSEDIQAVRGILQQFISRIDVDYDHIKITYRYPLNTDVISSSARRELRSLDGEVIDQQLDDLSDGSIQSIYEIAPHLAHAPKKPKPEKPICPRDAEIYRLHTKEKRSIPSLAKEFGLAEKSVWGICTRVRKTQVPFDALR
jgi:hypothetical protein